MVVGVLIIIQALMTDYELGAIEVVPLSFHLGMDVLLGAFLAASPWIFDFANEVYLPHLVVGLFAMGAGLLTKKVPEFQVAAHH